MNTSQGKRRISRAATAFALLIPVLVAWSSARADLEVNIAHIGFPSAQGDVIRNGAWVPIIVDVALVGQASFDGVARVSQFDIDGDEYSDSAELHLRTESGGMQRVFLFIPVNVAARTREKVAVEIQNSAGEVVPILSQGVRSMRAEPGQHHDNANDNEVLILALSSGTTGRVEDLSETKSAGKFTRRIRVAHLSPADLPPLWLGLDAVDCIVWDEASPQDISPQQIEALLTWVRHGGKLVIAAGRTAGALKLTRPIEAILPADIGDVTAVDNLRDMREKLVTPITLEGRAHSEDPRWLDIGFASPATVVRCVRRPGSSVLWHEASINSDLITRRREGSGQVVFCGITLRELFSAPGGVSKLYQSLLHLIPRDESVDTQTVEERSLFDRVVSAISFSTSGSLYLLIAALFSVAYVGLATFGTWSFLGARRWRQHSWSAFAAVAVVASLCSVSVVGSLRGFGDRLYQIAIVDTDADDSQGSATAFFGVKSGLDKRLDFWLPENWVAAREPQLTECFLRPIPSDSLHPEANTFADPVQYKLTPSTAIVNDVRLRGTLKQLEGRWHGPLAGKLTGRINVQRGEITDDSHLVNQLGVDLHDCLLFRSTVGDDYANFRDGAIFVDPIGILPTDGSKVVLRDRIGPRVSPTGQVRKQTYLTDKHGEWSEKFSGLLGGLGQREASAVTTGHEPTALLLLSTINELDPRNRALQKYLAMGREPWSRDRMRRIDISDQLRRGKSGESPGTAVIIGFAKGPGPIRLFARGGDKPFQAMQPEDDHAWTMYRVRIPVTLLDDLPPAPEKPKENSIEELEQQ